MVTSTFYESPVPPPDLLPPRVFVNGKQPDPYSAGQAWSVEVDTSSGSIESVELRPNVTVNTGGTPGTPTARVRNPGAILGTKVTVNLNGNPFVSCSPDMLLFIAQWFRGKYGVELDQLTTAELANATQSYGASANIPIDFKIPGLDFPNPKEFGMLPNEGGYCDDVRISGDQYGTVSSLMISPGATQAVGSAQNQLFVNAKPLAPTPSVLPDEQKRRIALAKKIGWGGLVRVNTEGSFNAAGQQTIQLDGGKRYTHFFLLTQAGSTRDYSDTCISQTSNTNLFECKIGTQPYFQRQAATVKNDVVTRLPVSWNTTGYWAVDLAKDKETDPFVLSKGIYVPPGQKLNFNIPWGSPTNGSYELVAAYMRTADEFARDLGIPIDALAAELGL